MDDVRAGTKTDASDDAARGVLPPEVEYVVNQATELRETVTRQGTWYVGAWVQQLFLIFSIGVPTAFIAMVAESSGFSRGHQWVARPLNVADAVAVYAFVATFVVALQLAVRTQSEKEPLSSALMRGRLLSALAVCTGAAAVVLGAQCIEMPIDRDATVEAYVAPIVGSALLAAAAADAVNVPMLRLGEFFRAAREKVFYDAYTARPEPHLGLGWASSIIVGAWLAASSGIDVVPQLVFAAGGTFALFLLGGLFIMFSTVHFIRLRRVDRKSASWLVTVPGIVALVLFALFGLAELFLVAQNPAEHTIAIEGGLFVVGLLSVAWALAIISSDRALKSRHKEALALFDDLNRPRKREELQRLLKEVADD